MSKFLKTLDEEAGKYGWSSDDKLKKFARALDNSREVGTQEICYRITGLGMCVGSRIVKFINVNKPKQRDSLLKAKLDSLGDNESPFMKSVIDYYQVQPIELEHITLADFAANYDIVYNRKQTSLLVADDKNTEEQEDNKSVHIFPLQNGLGLIRKRSFEAVLRYHLDKKNEEEMKRNLLLLFLPFRNEDKDIHSHKKHLVEDLFSINFDAIEEQRLKYEPHQELLGNIQERLQDIINEDKDVEPCF